MLKSFLHVRNTFLPEWRNWQTQQTQNLPTTNRAGSSPAFGTIFNIKKADILSGFFFGLFAGNAGFPV
jgi:hypothetical protein